MASPVEHQRCGPGELSLFHALRCQREEPLLHADLLRCHVSLRDADILHLLTDMNSDRPPSRPSIRVQPDAVHPPPRSLTSFQVLQRPPASLVTIEGAPPRKTKKKMYPSPALPFFFFNRDIGFLVGWIP
ncbi:hypothetical protein LY78DRAFT_219195 [Colletotrichum sublineola]|nr:hypothetical protein LY78DRAFT_219195 [Colletotrichum sublineola]